MSFKTGDLVTFCRQTRLFTYNIQEKFAPKTPVICNHDSIVIFLAINHGYNGGKYAVVYVPYHGICSTIRYHRIRSACV